MALTKARILSHVRKIAQRLNTRWLTYRQFREQLGPEAEDFRRYFSTFKDCLLEAGLKSADLQDWTRAELLSAFLEACVKRRSACGKPRAFARHLPCHPTLLLQCFKSWKLAKLHAKRYAREHRPGFPYLHQLPRFIGEWPTRRSGPPRRLKKSYAQRLGPRLRFRNLLHAPSCESGVVLLFGLLGEELGYRIETVGTRFPDCVALRPYTGCLKTRTGRARRARMLDGQRWERVRIEFEYRARNFQLHGHSLKGCDMIVCWKNDWPECPIEVLELSALVRKKLAEQEVLAHRPVT